MWRKSCAFGYVINQICQKYLIFNKKGTFSQNHDFTHNVTVRKLVKRILTQHLKAFPIHTCIRWYFVGTFLCHFCCRGNCTSVVTRIVFERYDTKAAFRNTTSSLQTVRRNTGLHAQVRWSQGKKKVYEHKKVDRNESQSWCKGVWLVSVFKGF